MPLVSVIIPNYNHAAFLQERLDAVFNQTFQDFEVILLDDASTDESLVLLKPYENHPKVSALVVNNENSGTPFVQWKKGIELAQGKYIWIAESDDSNHPAFLEHLVPVLETNPKMGIVFSAIEKKSKTTSEVYRPIDAASIEGDMALHEHMLTGNLIINASGAVFRKSLVTEDALKAITQFRMCGDWYLWSSILQESNAGFVNRTLTTYRIHEGASTNELFDNPNYYREGITVSRAVVLGLGDKGKDKYRTMTKWRAKVSASPLSETQKKELLQHLKKTYSFNEHRYLFLKRLKHKIKHLKSKFVSSSNKTT